MVCVRAVLASVVLPAVFASCCSFCVLSLFPIVALSMIVYSFLLLVISSSIHIVLPVSVPGIPGCDPCSIMQAGSAGFEGVGDVCARRRPAGQE